MLYLQTFHYTSTSGTSEAGVNIVGVLPGARWIGCRIQNIYLSTIYVYIYYICNAALARWGTADDRPLVVATYWDVQVTPQKIFAQKEQLKVKVGLQFYRSRDARAAAKQLASECSV